MRSFCFRPWFSRRWVLQELVVATDFKFVCGKKDLVWSDFMRPVQYIAIIGSTYHSNDTLGEIFAQCESKIFHRLRFQGGRKTDLLTLMATNFYCRTSNDHDRILSLTGIAWAMDDVYDKGRFYEMSLQDLHFYFAKLLVEQGRGPVMLLLAGLDTSDPDCASWIPNWSKTGHPTSLHFHVFLRSKKHWEFEGKCLFCATTYPDSEFR